MLRSVLPPVLIVVCSILIAIDLYVHAATADLGLWLRVLTNLLVIIAMVYTIRGQAKAGKSTE